MILDSINGVFSNIKDKATNPFFGTFIFVVLTKNWQLVYSVFNFDEKILLKDKLKHIERYLSTKEFWTETLYNVLITTCIVIVGYFIVAVFKTFSLWIEETVIPWMRKKAVSDKIKLKEDFDVIQIERDEYAEKFEVQRKLVRDYSKRNDELAAKEQDQDKSISQQLEKIHLLEIQANEFDSAMNERLEEINILSTKNAELIAEVANFKQLSSSRLTNLNNKNLEINKLKADLGTKATELMNYEQTSVSEISKLRHRVIGQLIQFFREYKKLFMIKLVDGKLLVVYHDQAGEPHFYQMNEAKFYKASEIYDKIIYNPSGEVRFYGDNLAIKNAMNTLIERGLKLYNYD